MLSEGGLVACDRTEESKHPYPLIEPRTGICRVKGFFDYICLAPSASQISLRMTRYSVENPSIASQSSLRRRS